MNTLLHFAAVQICIYAEFMTFAAMLQNCCMLIKCIYMVFSGYGSCRFSDLNNINHQRVDNDLVRCWLLAFPSASI